jgi:hypothetical protein
MIIEAGAPHQAHDHNHDQAPTPRKNPEKDTAGATVPMVTKEAGATRVSVDITHRSNFFQCQVCSLQTTHHIRTGVQLRETCKCGTPVMHTTASG